MSIVLSIAPLEPLLHPSDNRVSMSSFRCKLSGLSTTTRGSASVFADPHFSCRPIETLPDSPPSQSVPSLQPDEAPRPLLEEAESNPATDTEQPRRNTSYYIRNFIAVVKHAYPRYMHLFTGEVLARLNNSDVYTSDLGTIGARLRGEVSAATLRRAASLCAAVSVRETFMHARLC